MESHVYKATCRWRGTTGAGYEAYGRAHEAAAPPARASLALSSDPHFGGDPGRLNPEQLVVVAASSCQLLSFLALAARARLDVVSYVDEAIGEMAEDEGPMHLNRIMLRPSITIAGQASEDAVRRLVRLAHEECYVANSLRSDVLVEPTLTFVAPGESPAADE